MKVVEPIRDTDDIERIKDFLIGIISLTRKPV